MSLNGKACIVGAYEHPTRLAEGLSVVRLHADVAKGALEDAVSLLSGCPNIQLLLNAVQFSPSGRRFGSYYGYGG